MSSDQQEDYDDPCTCGHPRVMHRSRYSGPCAHLACACRRYQDPTDPPVPLIYPGQERNATVAEMVALACVVAALLVLLGALLRPVLA